MVKAKKKFTEIKGFPEQLHEAYKIKIGEKGTEVESKQGKKFKPPVKNDHFTIRTTERDKTGNFVIAVDVMKRLVRYNARLRGIKGFESESREIKEEDYKLVTDVPVRLLFDDIYKNFSTELSMYQGRDMLCHGNGEEGEWLGGAEPEMLKEGCKWQECKYYIGGQCKNKARLICVLECAPELGSVAVYRTTGFHTIRNIKTSLNAIAYQSNGILAGIPLHLTVSAKTVNPKPEITGTAWVVNICFRPPDKKILELGSEITKEALAIAGIRSSNKQQWLALEAKAEVLARRIGADEESAEAEADFVDEFHPEQAEAAVEADNRSAEAAVEAEKHRILEDAKARLIKQGQNIKSVNQGIAGMLGKELMEIRVWFKNTFKVEAEPPEAPATAPDKTPKPEPPTAIKAQLPAPAPEIPATTGNRAKAPASAPELPPLPGEKATAPAPKPADKPKADIFNTPTEQGNLF